MRMQADGHEIEVRVDGIEILLDIEEVEDLADPHNQWIVVAMNPVQVRKLVEALVAAHDVVTKV